MNDDKMNRTIAAAQAGDRTACRQLFENFLPLLKKAAGQAHIRTIAEDAFATASLSFLEAIRCYNKHRSKDRVRIRPGGATRRAFHLACYRRESLVQANPG